MFWNQQFFLSWLLYLFHILFTAGSMWHDSVLLYRLTDSHLEILKARYLNFSKINKGKFLWVHVYWLRTIENGWRLNSWYVLYIFPYPLVITEPINIFKNKGLWPYFQCFSKLVICTITDKQLLYHERVKSLTKFSFEVLPLVILFFGE